MLCRGAVATPKHWVSRQHCSWCILITVLIPLLLLQVLLALLVSCFSWELSPRMGGPAGVLAQTVAALELRVAQGMWLSPTVRI